jgi:hypothetical protein
MRVGCSWIAIALAVSCSGATRDPVPDPVARAAPTVGHALDDSDGGAIDASVAVAVDAAAPQVDAYKTFRMASPPEPTAFVFDPSADTNGTSSVGDVELSPRVLVALFGAPYVSDGTKVSGEYVFKGAKHVFTVYEWESTQNSDEGCGPMPAVFWMTDRPYDFHVGGSDDATDDDARAFEAWLRAQVSTMLHKTHAKKLAALERLVAQLHDQAITPAKAVASARSLRASWKLGPVAAKKVTQPLQVGGGRPGGFENWNHGGGKPCDPFADSGSRASFSVGREDPRSIWQEVLRALVEDELTAETVTSLHALLAAKPGEEWNAWETYSPTR